MATVLSRAVPRVAPSCWAALSAAEAALTSCGRTSAVTRLAVGGMTNPRPSPVRTGAGAR
ncbi:hypothetical protein [Streptoalloteichus tenebrarius]|uniref:hypothetical protein n=1 Tax=Streptoalloteichus tenebrarius (strain ATCC 17920 / DSM 40477 / JCM 4838 / CBS 697.72 / NBRC 16177 / NCIMB 11028 / NRRL B-12390 / A12253. 1 / ISP 5477) TaxID=1933 RepID=UPI0020A541E0|nr:hypothetical protein [Streptoalloteichus tenebrarius]